MKQHGKVLLADVHQNMLAGVRSLLENLFDTIFMVSDEASLLQGIKNIKPDLIVADLSFPVTGGINVVRLLQENHPEINLIVLSNFDDKIIIDECRKTGVSAFVLKRKAVDELVSAIEVVRSGGCYFSVSA